MRNIGYHSVLHQFVYVAGEFHLCVKIMALRMTGKALTGIGAGWGRKAKRGLMQSVQEDVKCKHFKYVFWKLKQISYLMFKIQPIVCVYIGRPTTDKPSPSPRPGKSISQVRPGLNLKKFTQTLRLPLPFYRWSQMQELALIFDPSHLCWVSHFLKVICLRLQVAAQKRFVTDICYFTESVTHNTFTFTLQK